MAATSLGALAEYDLYENRVERAWPLLVESTRIYRDLGDPFMIAMNLFRFALALALQARPAAAVRMLASGEARVEEIGRSNQSWMVEMNALTREKIRAQLDEAAFDEAWEAGAKMPLDDAVALALALEETEPDA